MSSEADQDKNIRAYFDFLIEKYPSQIVIFQKTRDLIQNEVFNIKNFWKWFFEFEIFFKLASIRQAIYK